MDVRVLRFPGSFERAKREDGVNLLKAIAFYVTPKVGIDVKLFKAVVASACGQMSRLSKLCRLSVPHPHTDSDVKACNMDSSNTQC